MTTTTTQTQTQIETHIILDDLFLGILEIEMPENGPSEKTLRDEIIQGFVIITEKYESDVDTIKQVVFIINANDNSIPFYVITYENGFLIVDNTGFKKKADDIYGLDMLKSFLKSCEQLCLYRVNSSLKVFKAIKAYPALLIPLQD